MDDLSKAATGQGSAEVLDRVLLLLEAQRLQHQALVAKAEEERTRASLQDEVFRAILSESPLKVLPLLDEATSTTIMHMHDANGLNLLHHAVRVGSYEVVDRLLELNTNLCDQISSPNGRPAHWTPFMVFIDTAKAVMDKSTYFYILGCLLHHSSLATLEVRAANGSSALHMACSKGMAATVKKTVYAIYNKAGESESALGLVSSLLNQPNGRGAGCVPGPWFQPMFYFLAALSFFKQSPPIKYVCFKQAQYVKSGGFGTEVRCRSGYVFAELLVWPPFVAESFPVQPQFPLVLSV